MSHHHKLSFWTAVLVNFNVMFGTGIFINTVVLAQLAGFFGFLSYLIVALLLVPLIICTGALLRFYPDGGFYAYASKTISPLAGFISAWAYFTGKLASAALLVHVFSSFITTLLPSLATINILILDSAVICLFAWLNLLHMKTGRTIMYTFMVFKVTPILFAILSSLYLYNFWSVPPQTLLWDGIPMAIPIVLFAFTGFEVCCSLSGSLENAEKNGPRVVFLTYGVVVSITILYQLFLFLTAGTQLMTQQNYLGVFPSLFSVLLPNNIVVAHHLTALLHIALACASLGGSYGIIFSNHWNLYTLAKHNHTFFAPLLTRLNHHAIPAACILVEALFCICYLLFTQGTVVVLQQISVLGSVIAYAMSMIGLICANKQYHFLRPHWLAWLALASCTFFVGACIRNFYFNGLYALYFFAVILLFGLGMFLITSKTSSYNNKS